MLRRGWVVLAVALLGGCATAGGLTPFERDGLWGYRDTSGRVAIEPKYLVADPFSPQGLAAVADDDGWSYIDVSGRVVIRPLLFDNGPDPFSEGLARFLRDGKFGFFDESGRVRIQPAFDFAEPFHEGLAAFCEGCRAQADGEHTVMAGGLWGYINREGRVAIPPRFEAAGHFENGGARVKRDGLWFTIDRSGRARGAGPR